MKAYALITEELIDFLYLLGETREVVLYLQETEKDPARVEAYIKYNVNLKLSITFGSILASSLDHIEDGGRNSEFFESIADAGTVQMYTDFSDLEALTNSILERFNVLVEAYNDDLKDNNTAIVILSYLKYNIDKLGQHLRACRK